MEPSVAQVGDEPMRAMRDDPFQQLEARFDRILVIDHFADVVQERGPSRRLHRGAQLLGHQRREVGALDQVVEDVLAVARPVAQAAEDLHQLFVELAAVGLEDRLVTGLANEVVDLRL